MADLGNFDANDVEPAEEFAPLPEGVYRVMIDDSEIKATKAGDGSYLALTLVLTGNEKNDGRKLFVNLNLQNKNQQAVEIAQRELSAICHAVGVLKPGDSSKLHDIPFNVKVGVEKRKDTGDLTNRIKAFMKLGDAGAAPANASQGESTGGKPGWMQDK